MTRKVWKPFITALLALFITSTARAETVLRLGIDTLPLSFGVPYRTAAIPTIYTTSAIFDALTRIDTSGNLKPGLATQWQSADGKTWTFTLRSDVSFSNGVPFTAEAVKVAVDYLASEEAATKEGLVREIPKMTGARVIDPHTVEITLAEPDALFPRSAAALMVGEPGQWQKLGRDGFGKEPVGTGPFLLQRWEPNRAVLTAFKKSWRAPKADRLEIIALPDRAARVQAVLSNQIDIAMALGPEDIKAITAAGGKEVRTPIAAVLGWSFMMIRAGQPVTGKPWNDVRVRKAMTMAINRQLIIDALLDGSGAVSSQPAPRVAFGYNTDAKPLPYDPAAAKKLLAEAGYPTGFSMTLTTTTGFGAADVEIAQRVADDLAQVGIAVEVRTMAMPQYLQNQSRATFESDAFVGGWPADPSIDVLRPLRLLSCLRREPFYCNESIMPKIRAAMTEMDEAKSLALRREIMAWYAEEVPALYLYEGMRFTGTTAKVSGFAEASGVIAYDAITVTP